MESTIYRKLAELIDRELEGVRRFGRPLEEVLYNLAENLLYEASQIEQSRGNDD